jgi:hypothetical protein
MTRTQRFVGVGVVLAAAFGLGYAGWRVSAPSRITVCELSGRPIHPNMRTIAFIGNSRKVLCCPTCALTAGAQTHQPVRFEQLTDFETSKPLRPEDAFAVQGSDLVPCDLPHGSLTTEMLNPDGQPVSVVFDRCSPSILAFAKRESADRFAAEHGGKVGRFLQMTAQ